MLLLLLLQATGVKVGEVGERSALVWMRCTAAEAREPDGACPGAPGRVRVRFGVSESLADARATPWVAVREDADFTAQILLEGLEPGTLYHYAAETEGRAALKGRFRTAPRRDAPSEAVFTVVTGQAYRDLDDPSGFHIYASMGGLSPDFVVPTGDSVYYDNDPPLATTRELARFHWQRMYSLPRHVAFHLHVPGYWEKDDHDTIWNDVWPGMKIDPRVRFTFEEGQALFREQVPAPATPYRTVRWGKSLEVWLLEVRDFRSPNRAPDGPGKTILGAEQKAWLRRTLLESDADWKVLVSPTPIVGPDRGGKGDNHANDAFRTEGDELRRWFGEKLPKNFFIACGDRH
jgi:alkaline phosphatase D